MSVKKATSLTMKLAQLLEEIAVAEQHGQPFNFGMIRNMLGKRRIILLPCVKNHHEVALPSRANGQASSFDRVRVTVVLEVSLIDSESEEQITSRWIGQAIDSPETCYDRAITNALEDFLRKTFLVIAANDDEPRETPTSTDAPEPKTSTIRRRPEGASPKSPSATSTTMNVVMASNDDVDVDMKNQLELLEASAKPSTPSSSGKKAESANDDAVVEAAEEKPTPPPVTEAWKAANALWRALVAEVVSSEVMDAFEESLEQKYNVDSWRRIEPDEIRTCCKILRKRSATTSDIRRISDREEYILSQLSTVPEGSSLNRVEAELERLTTEVVDKEVHDSFMELYLEKMKVEKLSEVSGRALIALVRKLRKIHGEEREQFVWRALTSKDESDHEAA